MSRLSAAWRFRNCERFSAATIVMTPPTSRPARRSSARARRVGPNAAELATSKSNSTRESVVFTPCPPGPDDRENRQTNSDSGITLERTRSGPGTRQGCSLPQCGDHRLPCCVPLSCEIEAESAGSELQHYVTGRIRTKSVTHRPVDVVLQALSDQSRRIVLDALNDGPATVGELAALVPIARPGVSRHLRVLREAGLVDVRREAQFRVYSLRPEPLAQVDEWLGHYRSRWEQRLDALHTEVARGNRARRTRT
jgi:DNA-binding transcriptional ArsR family regulator